MECPELDIITRKMRPGNVTALSKKEPILGTGRRRSGLQSYTDLNSLCYNSLTGQGQLLWVSVACSTVFGQQFSLVSMVSINLGIRFYGVETGDAGESIEPEESH